MQRDALKFDFGASNFIPPVSAPTLHLYLLQLHTHLQALNQAIWTRRITALHSSLWDLDPHGVSFCPFFCNAKKKKIRQHGNSWIASEVLKALCGKKRPSCSWLE